jgi:hypothetical protein
MFGAFSIFLSLLAVYFRGISSSIFAGDSGDISLSYFYAGVPHPPGYPLNTILGWLITRLPIGDTFAFRTNFVSAVFTALAISILYLIIFKLTKSKIVSLIGAATLAFVPLVWLYAHIAEVFQLTLVLVLTSLYFLLSWLELDKKKQVKNFKFIFLSITFLGLAVFHHQTTLMLVPSYTYILLKKRKIIFADAKKYIFLFGAFLIGFLPYIYIPIAAFRKTPINWDDPTTFERFFRLITRGDYGSFQASSGILGFSLKARFVQVIWYFKVLRADFTIVGLILIVIGLIWLFRKNKQLFIFLCLNLFFTGPFFLFYASFPLQDVFMEGVNERFLITNYLFLGIVLSLGIYFLTKKISKYLQKLSRYKILAVMLTTLLFALLPFTFFFNNYAKTDMSKSNEGSFLARDILNSVNPPGVLFLAGDTVAFNTLYEYYVGKVNNYSAVIGAGRLRYQEYRVAVKKDYPYLSTPDDFTDGKIADSSKAVTQIIYNNKDKLPIYSVYNIPIPDNYVWLQQGLVLRLYKKTERPSAKELIQIINERLNHIEYDEEKTKRTYVSLLTENIINTYADMFTSNATTLMNEGDLVGGKKLFERALSNSPENTRAALGLGLINSKNGDCVVAENIYKGVMSYSSKDWQPYQALSVLYRDCFHNQEKSADYLKQAENLYNVELAKPVNQL